MKKIWAIRKNNEGVSPVVATILLVAITVILAAVLYVMASGMFNTTTSLPVIGMNRGSGPTDYFWTITTFEGGKSVYKSDVYLQLRVNGTSTFLIMTELLSNASGTHGFKYLSATTGNYLGVGDVFTLSKNYLQGTTITLVNADASGQFCIMTA
jgi:flagellin-like protein